MDITISTPAPLAGFSSPGTWLFAACLVLMVESLVVSVWEIRVSSNPQ